MHTHIPNLMETPFRGITTIQLFDKEGNLVEETQHENTYNQRLQFFSYIDTILSCGIPAIPSTADTNIIRGDTLSKYTNRVNSSTILGSSNTSYDVMQPYATLWLTNYTANEDVNGYPNGIPVALATSAGVPGGVASNRAAGFVNLAESYLSNDRLHLVFDFDTSRGNITFDSLWFYPSQRRYNNGGDAVYNVVPFFHGLRVLRSDHPTFEMPSGYARVFQRPLNNCYTMLIFSNNTSSYDYVKYALYYADRAIIFNEVTGEVVSDCTFSPTMNLQNVFYFDEGSNALYQIYTSTTGHAIFEESTSTGGPFYKINLTTGTQELVDYTRNLFGMKKSDYNYANSTSGTWSYDTHVYYLADENTTMVMIPTEGPDADTGFAVPYISWFSFDPLLERFNLVKRLRVYSGATYKTTVSPNLDVYKSFVKDGLLYLSALVTPDLDSDLDSYNRLAVFNIKTGELLYDKRLSNIDATITAPYGSLAYRQSLDEETNNSSKSFDFNRYKTPMLYIDGYNLPNAKLKIDRISTALWTTHNKLTSPITKTDQTTMKIQYDIIWDNIKDTIVPGLI